MSPLAAKPVLHGRDHCPGGADPIPCLPSAPAGGGVVYGDYVRSFSSLIGYWRLGETGSPWADTSGVGPHNMTLTGSGAALTPDVTGGLPPAQDDGAVQLNYDGTSSSGGRYLATGATSFFQLNPFTVAAFVKPAAVAGTRRGEILSSQGWSVAGGGYRLGWALQMMYPSGVVRFGLGQPSGAATPERYAESPGPLVAGTWCHVVGSYDGSNIRLYLNGTLVATTAYSSAAAFGNANGVNIGYQFGNSENFWLTGTVDEAAIWNDALDDGQIATLAGATAGTADTDGQVLTSDGTGGTTWDFPTVKVDGTRYDEILSGTGISSTDNTDGTVTLDAAGGDPAGDTKVWLPLTTVVSSVPELVWDASNSLIPTLTPI